MPLSRLRATTTYSPSDVTEVGERDGAEACDDARIPAGTSVPVAVVLDSFSLALSA